MSPEPADPRARICPTCGALNGAGFDRCVRCAGALSAAARSADGASQHVDGRPLWATRGILGLTALVFALQMAAMLPRVGLGAVIAGGTTRDMQHLAGSPGDALRFGALLVHPAVAFAEPWRLLSAVFVHFSLIHVVMNMVGLMNLGRIAEPAVGAARFLVAYVVTGIVGFAVTVPYGLLGGGVFRTAGASGAVLGVMGLVLGWLLRRRDPRWKNFALQAVLYSVIFGFVVHANNAAHLGGLACGVVFGALYAGPPAEGARARRPSDLLANGAAVVALLACLASVGLALLSRRAPV